MDHVLSHLLFIGERPERVHTDGGGDEEGKDAEGRHAGLVEKREEPASDLERGRRLQQESSVLSGNFDTERAFNGTRDKRLHARSLLRDELEHSGEEDEGDEDPREKVAATS
eukprot:Rmarinus@m.7411